MKYVVYLCRGSDRCCVFCMNCEVWNCMYNVGSMSVSSCRCGMFVSCVLCAFCDIPNVAVCMTCSLLMLVEDARCDHIEDAYVGAGLMTAL